MSLPLRSQRRALGAFGAHSPHPTGFCHPHNAEFSVRSRSGGAIRKSNAHCPVRQGKIDSFQESEHGSRTREEFDGGHRIRYQWPEGQCRCGARHAAAVDRARASQIEPAPNTAAAPACAAPARCTSTARRCVPARSPHRKSRASRSPPSRACRPTPIIRCSAPGSRSRCRNAATASPARSCRPRICLPTNKKPSREQIVAAHGRQSLPLRHLSTDRARHRTRSAGGVT